MQNLEHYDGTFQFRSPKHKWMISLEEGGDAVAMSENAGHGGHKCKDGPCDECETVDFGDTRPARARDLITTLRRQHIRVLYDENGVRKVVPTLELPYSCDLCGKWFYDQDDVEAEDVRLLELTEQHNNAKRLAELHQHKGLIPGRAKLFPVLVKKKRPCALHCKLRLVNRAHNKIIVKPIETSKASKEVKDKALAAVAKALRDAGIGMDDSKRRLFGFDGPDCTKYLDHLDSIVMAAFPNRGHDGKPIPATTRTHRTKALTLLRAIKASVDHLFQMRDDDGISNRVCLPLSTLGGAPLFPRRSLALR